ncbi:NUDIX hydrolase [Micromonospora sp. NPDC005553]|uniref:NUDIX hydrolase n=1 Tax=Micromonospora sp. NPDC005553 TaxID=3364232 RepID=UPI003698FFDD
MSFRLAAYAVCIEEGRVLLAHYVSPTGDTHWTLPGGKVEQAEDPFDAVVREVAEETGCVSVVERLLGVDSRVIPAAAAHLGIEDQNVGIFYQVRITGGVLRPRGERRDRRVGLDIDFRCRRSVPVVAGRCRSCAGASPSGDRSRLSGCGRRPDSALTRRPGNNSENSE